MRRQTKIIHYPKNKTKKEKLSDKNDKVFADIVVEWIDFDRSIDRKQSIFFLFRINITMMIQDRLLYTASIHPYRQTDRKKDIDDNVHRTLRIQ